MVRLDLSHIMGCLWSIAIYPAAAVRPPLGVSSVRVPSAVASMLLTNRSLFARPFLRGGFDGLTGGVGNHGKRHQSPHRAKSMEVESGTKPLCRLIRSAGSAVVQIRGTLVVPLPQLWRGSDPLCVRKNVQAQPFFDLISSVFTAAASGRGSDSPPPGPPLSMNICTYS